MSEELTFEMIKSFKDAYANEIGALESIVGNLATDAFSRKLLAISKSYQFQQFQEEMTSSLRGLLQQNNLITLRNLTNKFAFLLKPGTAMGSLFLSLYEDWSAGNDFPEKNIKTGVSLLAGSLIGMAFLSQLGTGAIIGGLSITVSGVVGYLINRYWDNTKNCFMASNLSDSIKRDFTTASETRSPLAIDLDGDGVETVSVANGVYFDHDGNGFAEKSGWISADDALLVRDVNEDGEINDGTPPFDRNNPDSVYGIRIRKSAGKVISY